jgi:phospholipase D1/2
MSGLVPGERVELTFHELPGYKDSNKSPRVLGKVAGKATAVASKRGQFSLKLDEPPPTVNHDNDSALSPPHTVEFLLPSDGEQPTTIAFDLASENADQDEGDAWEVAVSAKNLGVTSPPQMVARVRRALRVGTEATYQQTEGNDVKFYNDGCVDETGGPGGAFADLLDAISKAKKFIFVADWSFHPLFRPSRDGANAKATHDNSIGKILIDRAKAGAMVAIHTWDHTGAGAPDPLNDNAMRQLKELAGGTLPNGLFWRASSNDRSFMSHHQKFVVLDSPTEDGRYEVRVFFGGLDLSKGRFDHPGHPIWPPPQDGPGNERTWTYAQQCSVKGYSTDEWYNAEFKDARDMPRQPWHDIHAQMSGPSAWDFVREFVGRWNCDPDFIGSQGHVGLGASLPVMRMFYSLYEGTGSGSFVKPWEPHQGPFTAQVVRSIQKSHWNDEGLKKYIRPGAKYSGRPGELHWNLKDSGGCENSIQLAYLRAIDQAEKFIYIETQYLMGAGLKWEKDQQEGLANLIPDALVKKIKERKSKGKPFHVYIVMPMYPEGDPSNRVVRGQRRLTWKTIEYMISAIGKDYWKQSLSFYFLANWNHIPDPKAARAAKELATRASRTHIVERPHGMGTIRYVEPLSRKERVKASQRYMIYVHSKLMLVDDRVALMGSANLNERSLAGDRDTEICCTFWPTLGKETDCTKALKDFRKQLWKEHLGAKGLPSNWEDAAGCAAKLQATALANYQAFRASRGTGEGRHLCQLIFKVDARRDLHIDDDTMGADMDSLLLPDSPEDEVDKAKKAGWAWSSPGSSLEDVASSTIE